MTSMVLEQLHRDHRNMRELLAVVEKELGGHAEGRAPDYELLRDVLDYLLNYPDLVHHPKEDLIYKRILARDSTAGDEIGDLIADHATLAGKTRALAAALRFVGADGEVPRDWIEKIARDYFEALRGHMEHEETGVFQMALRKLDDEDWLAIDLASSKPESLLVGRQSEERYLALHDRIMRLAA